MIISLGFITAGSLEELKRLDLQRNLPISIIMGDVNGLKLVNDVFGHAEGDRLLKEAADAMKRKCRADDIIARWGSDEFVILLPKTSSKDAEQIALRIKESYAKTQIHKINGSISMGVETKFNMDQNTLSILSSAEAKMYSAKALERGVICSSAIESIIQKLHETSPREKEHSVYVSELCQLLGQAMGLDDIDLRKCKEAGYLHDIGKVTLNPKLLKKRQGFTAEEAAEIEKHVSVGYRLLNSFDDTVDIAEAVLAHHERWDGSGYPKGLKGNEIPLLARIITITGNFDRYMHESETADAFSKTRAINTIMSKAGTQFDPYIAGLFARIIESVDLDKLDAR